MRYVVVMIVVVVGIIGLNFGIILLMIVGFVIVVLVVDDVVSLVVLLLLFMNLFVRINGMFVMMIIVSLSVIFGSLFFVIMFRLMLLLSVKLKNGISGCMQCLNNLCRFLLRLLSVKLIRNGSIVLMKSCVLNIVMFVVLRISMLMSGFDLIDISMNVLVFFLLLYCCIMVVQRLLLVMFIDVVIVSSDRFVNRFVWMLLLGMNCVVISVVSYVIMILVVSSVFDLCNMMFVVCRLIVVFMQKNQMVRIGIVLVIRLLVNELKYFLVFGVNVCMYVFSSIGISMSLFGMWLMVCFSFMFFLWMLMCFVVE